MVSIVNRNLLKQQRMAVSSEGDLVVMTLGNVDVKMPYETALLLSQWLRVRAKEAKGMCRGTGALSARCTTRSMGQG
jgi:hypothetical protein